MDPWQRRSSIEVNQSLVARFHCTRLPIWCQAFHQPLAPTLMHETNRERISFKMEKETKLWSDCWFTWWCSWFDVAGCWWNSLRQTIPIRVWFVRRILTSADHNCRIRNILLSSSVGVMWTRRKVDCTLVWANLFDLHLALFVIHSPVECVHGNCTCNDRCSKHTPMHKGVCALQLPNTRLLWVILSGAYIWLKPACGINLHLIVIERKVPYGAPL